MSIQNAIAVKDLKPYVVRFPTGSDILFEGSEEAVPQVFETYFWANSLEDANNYFRFENFQRIIDSGCSFDDVPSASLIKGLENVPFSLFLWFGEEYVRFSNVYPKTRDKFFENNPSDLNEVSFIRLSEAAFHTVDEIYGGDN